MRVLIVGSLDGQVGAAAQIAIKRGATVAQADDVHSALGVLRSGEGADVVLIDVQMDVGKLTQGLLAERITVPVVACGIGTDRQSAVRAIKAGAVEYIPLPPSAELIAAVLTAVAEEPQAIVYRDPKLADVLKLADQVAASSAGILIAGASGTGKELLARYLHNKSRRADKRFVAVNCAAIPENLLESELFGHEKGAFTGAVARRIGKFEEATGGTLLLDEISEMDPRLQAKLLRVIQESEIDRVGGAKPVKVDVRIIATTNRILADEVAKGTFREDLYFRLNVVTLSIPTLPDGPHTRSLWVIITDPWCYGLSHDHRRSTDAATAAASAPSSPTGGAGRQSARHREPTPTRRPPERECPGTGGHGAGTGPDAPGRADRANRVPPAA